MLDDNKPIGRLVSPFLGANSRIIRIKFNAAFMVSSLISETICGVGGVVSVVDGVVSVDS